MTHPLSPKWTRPLCIIASGILIANILTFAKRSDPHNQFRAMYSACHFIAQKTDHLPKINETNSFETDCLNDAISARWPSPVIKRITLLHTDKTQGRITMQDATKFCKEFGSNQSLTKACILSITKEK